MHHNLYHEVTLCHGLELYDFDSNDPELGLRVTSDDLRKHFVFL